jgi:hypothetical protein
MEQAGHQVLDLRSEAEAVSRHRHGRKWKRADLLAEIERLNRIVTALQEDRARLLREVAAPGAEDETVYVPVIKLDHTPAVPLITPDGKRTTVHTGPHQRVRQSPKWARDS